MGISCLKAVLQINSSRANFGVAMFKHKHIAKFSLTFTHIPKLTSAILAISPNFACHSHESLYRLSHSRVFTIGHLGCRGGGGGGGSSWNSKLAIRRQVVHNCRLI